MTNPTFLSCIGYCRKDVVGLPLRAFQAKSCSSAKLLLSLRQPECTHLILKLISHAGKLFTAMAMVKRVYKGEFIHRYILTFALDSHCND